MVLCMLFFTGWRKNVNKVNHHLLSEDYHSHHEHIWQKNTFKIECSWKWLIQTCNLQYYVKFCMSNLSYFVSMVTSLVIYSSDVFLIFMAILYVIFSSMEHIILNVISMADTHSCYVRKVHLSVVVETYLAWQISTVAT